MKKILIIGLIVLAVFLIYLSNLDKKVYYLALGDSLANGQSTGKKVKSYSDYVRDYLKEQNLLETYINEYAENGYRTTDLIKAIKDNKKITRNKKEITLQNALIKADLVTISIGANDILTKINEKITYDEIYNYIDDLTDDIDELFKLMREYCKEDIVLVGYYNPYIESKETSDIFDYLNDSYKEISKKYKIIYVEIDLLFRENPDFLPSTNDIHPSKAGYKAIAGQIIGSVNKTLLKS